MRSCGLALAIIAGTVVVTIGGCHKDDAEPAKTSQPGSGSGVASGSAPAAAAGVELFVDDKSVATITPAQLATWPRVDQLVPVTARRLGTWQDVTFVGKNPKPLELKKPSDAYPELVPALYLAADQTAAFGMFDPVELAKHGQPKVHEDGITAMHIKLAQGGGRGEHESGEGGGTDPSQLKIAIKTAKGESVLDGPTLLAVPRTGMPGDDSKDPRGWPLATILDAAGIKKFDKVIVSDAEGTNLTLDKADFDAKVSIPYVKLNRQGSLRITVFKKQGDTWQKAGDLRGLAQIEIK